ncbi:unnamed protein product [Pieris brassicae]|uniref:Uncharacterized protein n=1 Tax=Pieris brassicae TaxID=7116 RepID=A0A9P0XET2_PIEBR|nr:unnamed protein product [Pieris brassicae]
MSKHAGATTHKTQEMHSIIVKSSGPETSGEILEHIRSKIDAKNTGLNVDRIRKVKDQRVVIWCTSSKRITEIRDRLKDDQKLTVEEAKTKDPLVVLRGVISTHTDEEVRVTTKQNLETRVSRGSADPKNQKLQSASSPHRGPLEYTQYRTQPAPPVPLDTRKPADQLEQLRNHH